MRGIVIDFKDLSDSREIIEQKPPRFMLYFFYLLLLMIIALLAWAYFAKKEIVVKTQGMIVANSKQSIIPLTNGKITKLYFDEGDVVKKGDLLLELEHESLLTQLQMINDNIETHNNQLSVLEKYEKAINEEKNLFDKNNKDELEKYLDFQKYMTEYNALESEHLKEEFRSNKLVELYSQKENAIMYLQQYEFEALNLRNEIEKHKIYADIDGTIHYVNPVFIGDSLQAGYEVIRINSNSGKKVQIAVSNQDISRIHVGQAIRIDVRALPNRDYGYGKAKVTKIESDARVDQQTGNSFFLVEAELITEYLESKDDRQELIVGMIVDSRMVTGEQRYLFWILDKLELWVFK